MSATTLIVDDNFAKDVDDDVDAEDGLECEENSSCEESGVAESESSQKSRGDDDCEVVISDSYMRRELAQIKAELAAKAKAKHYGLGPSRNNQNAVRHQPLR